MTKEQLAVIKAAKAHTEHNILGIETFKRLREAVAALDPQPRKEPAE